MGFTQATGSIKLAANELGPVAPHDRPRIGHWLCAGRPAAVLVVHRGRRWGGGCLVVHGGRTSCCRRVAKLDQSESRRRLDRAYGVLPELAELRNRPAGSVSGGQGKMVALGRALMLGTSLVILDEPFQGLAPVLAQRYAEALRRLRAQDPDITLLVTESNPKLLEAFADTVLSIERGEISVVRAGNSGQ